MFHFEDPLKPVRVVLHDLFLSWKNNNMADDSDQLDCSLQELSLHGKSEFK